MRMAANNFRAGEPEAGRSRRWWLDGWWLLAVLLAVLSIPAGPVAAQQQGSVNGSVKGRVIGDPADGSLQGATVVLMWFRTNAQGKPEAGPLARQVAGENGSFTFLNVPIDPKASYQLGTRVDGKLVGSDPFTFTAGVRERTVNITIPETVEDRASLSIEQVLYVLEPRVGKVWITQVLHLSNNSRNIISLLKEPLELPLPGDAEEVEMIRLEVREGKHERIGAKLLVFGILQPGNTTIALRYALDATWGRISVNVRHALPATELLVLAEKGTVNLAGAAVEALQPRTIEKTTYDAWGASNLPVESRIKFTASGIPVAQWIYLLPLIGFFILMMAVVLWFVRKRLQGGSSTQGESSAV